MHGTENNFPGVLQLERAESCIVFCLNKISVHIEFEYAYAVIGNCNVYPAVEQAWQSIFCDPLFFCSIGARHVHAEFSSSWSTSVFKEHVAVPPEILRVGKINGSYNAICIYRC